jgi:hypothetical protein
LPHAQGPHFSGAPAAPVRPLRYSVLRLAKSLLLEENKAGAHSEKKRLGGLSALRIHVHQHALARQLDYPKDNLIVLILHHFHIHHLPPPPLHIRSYGLSRRFAHLLRRLLRAACLKSAALFGPCQRMPHVPCCGGHDSFLVFSALYMLPCFDRFELACEPPVVAVLSS